MGCDRGGPACPPVPGATMACVRHTSAPAPVGTNEHTKERWNGVIEKYPLSLLRIDSKCWENKKNRNIFWCPDSLLTLCWPKLIPIGLQGARRTALLVSVKLSAHSVIWATSCSGANVKTAVQMGWRRTQHCENAQVRHCAALLHVILYPCYTENEVFHDVGELQYNIRCLCLSVSECSIGCEVCVRRNTCVRCRADLYFLHGQCHLTCPRGFEPDVQLMQCIPQGERNSLLPHSWNVKYNSSSFQHHINAPFQYRSLCMCISAIPHFCFLLAVSLSLISLLIVDCEVGEWTDWDQCVRRRSTRPYRRGQEKRTRLVLRPPSVYGVPCPHLSEIRKCVIKKRPKSPSRL